MTADHQYTAIVHLIVPEGRHGPYAVAKADSFGSITFSLDRAVWEETHWPEPGTYVILSQVTKKRAGWRAGKGRFLDPSDEQLV